MANLPDFIPAGNENPQAMGEGGFRDFVATEEVENKMDSSEPEVAVEKAKRKRRGRKANKKKEPAVVIMQKEKELPQKELEELPSPAKPVVEEMV